MTVTSTMSFYIKERHNPQLGVYYVDLGELPQKEARAHRRSLYGSNVLHEFPTREQYDTELNRLREAGEKIQ